jgi:hypothetical protein
LTSPIRHHILPLQAPHAGTESELLPASANVRAAGAHQQLVGMADQEDGPNSMDFPIGVGSFTGHTRGGDGEPLSFGPGTYRNVFDGNADQSGVGNYTVKSSRSACVQTDLIRLITQVKCSAGYYLLAGACKQCEVNPPSKLTSFRLGPAF